MDSFAGWTVKEGKTYFLKKNITETESEPFGDYQEINGIPCCKSFKCTGNKLFDNEKKIHKKERCQECQNLWRNSLRKKNSYKEKLEKAQDKIEELQEKIKSLKNKSNYNKNKAEEFEDILKSSSEEKEYYLVSLLNQAIKKKK